VNGTVMLIIYVVLFGGIFYFLAVRPQRRQKSQHAEMMSMLKRGDEVVTIGGMYGTVKKVGPDWVIVEVAPRTQIRFMKRAISSISTPMEEEEEEEYVDEEEYEDAEEAGELEAGEEYEDDAEYEEGEEEYSEEEAGEEEEADATAVEDEEIPEAPEAPEVGTSKQGKRS
jgi:preprotein translocase subunit YajC